MRLWLPHLKLMPFIGLCIVYIIYSKWYVGPSMYGKMAGLAPGMPLQEAVYYSGAHAKTVLGAIDGPGRITAVIVWLGDIPYMLGMAIIFQTLIHFGLAYLKSVRPMGRILLYFPILFLLADISEDLSLLITMFSGLSVMGMIAGIMTTLKFLFVFLAGLSAVAMTLAGLTGIIMRSRQSE